MRMQSVNLGSRELGAGSGCKSGFGLIEVLAAAVVLGFLLVGLGILQKGNREAIIRVRARDAANIVAQHVLDSLGSVGVSSLVEDPGNGGFIVNNTYTYHFEGKSQGIIAAVDYTVQVGFEPDTHGSFVDSTIVESTRFTIENRVSGVVSDSEKSIFAKSLEATVSWDFKNTTQSIKVSRVVR
jgi:type II secretory pathway pseudopilin PulG